MEMKMYTETKTGENKKEEITTENSTQQHEYKFYIVKQTSITRLLAAFCDYIVIWYLQFYLHNRLV